MNNISKPFSPMLASKAGDKIVYPIFVSPKLDGIRAVIRDEVVMSRTLKPIPNKHIQEVLGKPEYNGLDGEMKLIFNFYEENMK